MTTELFRICLLLIAINSNIQEVVREFHQLHSKEAEIKFIHKYQNNHDPSVSAYVISAEMKQLEYASNPYYKLKAFNTHKKRLNQLINQNNSNIHLRYIRLVVQENTPAFLGYDTYIDEDIAFIRKKLSVVDDTDFMDTYIKANTSL